MQTRYPTERSLQITKVRPRGWSGEHSQRLPRHSFMYQPTNFSTLLGSPRSTALYFSKSGPVYLRASWGAARLVLARPVASGPAVGGTSKGLAPLALG